MSEQFRESIWDRHGVVAGILDSVPLPRMAKINQIFEDNSIKDIAAVIDKEFAKPEIASCIKPGMDVAIAAGSRGIANLALIIREVVRNVKALGGKPFIFPAMGSHGGATDEGQREVLNSYGITEESIGAPIRSSMETVIIGSTQNNKPVHIDKHAAAADGIILVARVKPHTAFRGPVESGLMKMAVIGLGKQKGAESCHQDGFGNMAKNLELFGTVILEKTKLMFGVAIVENAFDNTSKIEAVLKERIKTREPELLDEARGLMPKIQFPKFDILIVDQIGKNFSGDGADPNITGTYCTPYASGGPECQRYVILDISDESHGNAVGMGMADFITKRLYDKIDFDASYPNALTSTVVSGVRLPMVLKNDRSALQAAVFTAVGIDKIRPKIVRIKNSSHVEEIWISEALLEEARRIAEVRIIEDAKDFPFNREGNLW